MQHVNQSEPRAAFRRIYFTCVDTASLLTRLQATDMSTFTVKLTKNGATPASAAAASPVEVGVTDAKGLFYVELAVADTDTAGVLVLEVTNTAGTKVMERREILVAIDQAIVATAITGTLSATSFTTSLTSAVDGAYVDTFVHFLSGALVGQTKKVGAYNGATKLITLATINSVQQQFTGAPANLDVFAIINR